MNGLEDVAPMKDSSSSWMGLADRVLHGHRLSPDEAIAVLARTTRNCSICWPPPTVSAAIGTATALHLNFLVNAKSGLCGEDCRYCSQSKASTAVIPQYRLLDAERLLDGARVAAQRRAGTYCIVLAGAHAGKPASWIRSPRIIPHIKSVLCVADLRVGWAARRGPGGKAQSVRRRSREP